MNIDPLHWILLTIVGVLSGAINALKASQKTGVNTRQAMLIWVVEEATALFVTINTFLVLHSFLPLLIAVLSRFFPEAIAVKVPTLGLIGLSGWVTHVGLWNLILLVRGIRERRKTS